MKYTYNNSGYKYDCILEDTKIYILYFVIMKVHIAKNRFQNLLVILKPIEFFLKLMHNIENYFFIIPIKALNI
jgi:hypothetical protein